MRKYNNHFSTNQGLSIFFDTGLPVAISRDNPLYYEITQKLNNNDVGDIEEYCNYALKVSRSTNGKFTLVDGCVLLHGTPMPEALSELLLKVVEAGQDAGALEKFWENCCANPNPESRDSLYDYIKANNFTLTNDGCFIGYKKVRDNYLDSWSGKVKYEINSVVAMDRAEVDANRNSCCSHGIHVAAWEYAKDFSGDRLLEIKVNPKDVVSVPYSYHNQKMRVCAVLVMGEIEQQHDTVLHPTTFDAQNKAVLDSFANDEVSKVVTITKNGETVASVAVSDAGKDSTPAQPAKTSAGDRVVVIKTKRLNLTTSEVAGLGVVQGQRVQVEVKAGQVVVSKASGNPDKSYAVDVYGNVRIPLGTLRDAFPNLQDGDSVRVQKVGNLLTISL